MGPTALLTLRKMACWGFFRPKNPTTSAVCEPANLGTKGQHATSRPPKPLKGRGFFETSETTASNTTSHSSGHQYLFLQYLIDTQNIVRLRSQPLESLYRHMHCYFYKSSVFLFVLDRQALARRSSEILLDFLMVFIAAIFLLAPVIDR
jgi:hypothetical protein